MGAVRCATAKAADPALDGELASRARYQPAPKEARHSSFVEWPLRPVPDTLAPLPDSLVRVQASDGPARQAAASAVD